MEIDPPSNGNTSTAEGTSRDAAPVGGENTTMAAASASKATQLSDSLKLEHQFLRVPFEHYKKIIRANHRSSEKEVSAVISAVNSTSPDLTRDDAVSHLSSLVSRLQGLKRKLEEGNQAENLQEQRCRARLAHLESANAENISNWSNTRLKRILVDYMLRMSYYESAAKLAESSSIEDLVDIEVFYDAKRVIEALQNKDVAPALAWCADNKSRLKKSKVGQHFLQETKDKWNVLIVKSMQDVNIIVKGIDVGKTVSKFEFQLRLQEFIELVRADATMRAIAYARKYLAPWGTTHMKELQRVIATLAFKSNTDCGTYKILFEPKQWDHLVDQFKQEFYRLYGMTVEPLLNIYLQAGLSALKTPFCSEDGCPVGDPMSQQSFRELALSLPFSKQQHSKLVCYITKELMDTENPPMVLPNGHVYSTKALEDMSTRNNGRIICPRTGLVCRYKELVRAYIS